MDRSTVFFLMDPLMAPLPLACCGPALLASITLPSTRPIHCRGSAVLASSLTRPMRSADC